MEHNDAYYADIRQQLHRHPQTAGCEQFAHDTIVRHLQGLHPDKVYTHVGGWGVVAVWGSEPQAPTVAFRADTDALPIGHRCGHDGHTTILLRLAEEIDKSRPGGDGRNVLLLWQPAEETGTGAQAVVESGILDPYNIVAFYALHNIPGREAGRVLVCPHTFAAASTGIVYRLEGRETHASTPELGLNPGLAVSEIIQRFAAFNAPPSEPCNAQFSQATLICVRLGSPAFGTSAGQAEVMFTLRAFTNAAMERLLREANEAVDAIASRYGLSVGRVLQEPFAATENHPEAVGAVRRAAAQAGLPVEEQGAPFCWSEDFGTFLRRWPGAMFGIGSGMGQPELHHPDYDFPDALTEPAARMFMCLARG